MAEVINFNRARKARDKADDKRQAEINRAKFGRTKAERQKEEAQAEQAARLLDGHKLKSEDEVQE